MTEQTITEQPEPTTAEDDWPCGEGMCQCSCSADHACGCDCPRCDECMQREDYCDC
jgi:hypothetical protein